MTLADTQFALPRTALPNNTSLYLCTHIIVLKNKTYWSTKFTRTVRVVRPHILTEVTFYVWLMLPFTLTTGLQLICLPSLSSLSSKYKLTDLICIYTQSKWIKSANFITKYLQFTHTLEFRLDWTKINGENNT